MGLPEIIPGDLLVMLVVPGAVMWLTLAIFAPFNKAIGKALSSAIPCIGGCCAFFCGFFGPWLQPGTTLLLLLWTFILLMFNPIPIAVIGAVIGIFVGVFGVLLRKLPPRELVIMGIPLASRKYNSFWMFLFGLGWIGWVTFLYPIGALIGFIILIALIITFIAGIVLIAVFAPEAVAPMAAEAGVGGAAAGMAGMEGVAAGGEAMGAGEFAGMAEEGAGGLRAMGAAGRGMGGIGEIAEAERGVPPEAAQMEEQVEQMQNTEVQRAQSAVDTQQNAAQTELEEAESDLERADTPEEKKSAQQRVSEIQKRMEELGKRSQKLLNSFKEATGGETKIGGIFGRHVDSSGKMATWEVVILFIFLAFFALIVAAYILPENSPAYNTVKVVFDGIKSGVQSISRGILNFFDYIISWFRAQFTPCEIGATGVPCKILGVRPCEPFCISPTGRDTPWKGFEIKKLEIVPATVYDYQKFSVLAEFVNDGAGDATFAPVGEPTFGFFQTGGKLRCEWGLGTIIFWEPACRKVFPIQEGSAITTLTSGTCAKPGGEFKSPCTLEPGDTSQIRWFGFDIEEGVIRKGITVKPDITISTDYFFLVPNDVVGTIAVQTFQEQLATSTVEKKEKRIVQKINKAYSPPGPLMIAMGTAEEQVVSGIPTLFLVQFANKGSGVASQLNPENIKLYMPPEFEPLQGEGLCDFKLWKKVSELTDDEKKEWNPGPGFENHAIYEPNQGIPEIAQTRNPLETPTLFCVLKTPENVEKVKTYDFKMRITQYMYTEQKRTRISIIGTVLDITPTEEAEVEKIKSFRLGRCPNRLISGFCYTPQTLEFDQEYNVKKITVNAKRGGGWGCADRRIEITAQDAAGGNVYLGKTPSVPPQQWRGIPTVVFPESVKIKKVKADLKEATTWGDECPYLDDITAIITYTE